MRFNYSTTKAEYTVCKEDFIISDFNIFFLDIM